MGRSTCGCHSRMPRGHCEFGLIDEFDVKDQIGFWRNPGMRCVWSGTALCAVCKLPGDEDAPLAAHSIFVLLRIEAGNQATHSLREAQGLRWAELHFTFFIALKIAVLASNGLAGMIVR